MAWIKLDDHWMQHPKIIKVGRDCRDLWLASISWCAIYLTDGMFPEEALPTLATMAGIDVANCQEFATRLLDACLWNRTENIPNYDYEVHDYLDYQPSKRDLLSTRQARSDAGRKGGRSKVANVKQNSSKIQANDKQNSTPYPYPNPNPTTNSSDDSTQKLSTIYTQNIGPVTTVIETELAALVDKYTSEWVEQSINVSIQNEHRNMGYIKGILSNWEEKGEMTLVNRKPPKQGSEEYRRDYLAGGYADIIEH